MSEEIKKQEIKIEIDEQTANGNYSNLALITLACFSAIS